MPHRLKKTRQTAEFGDFQTPPSIAQKACTSLSRAGISPKSIVEPVGGKPIVLDDTSNFIPARNRAEAEYLASLLNSSTARDLFNSFVFWDNKRPITIDLLARLDTHVASRRSGKHDIRGLDALELLDDRAGAVAKS